jgi:metal-responsive CopG/Arc/MetJ family transcriptional regulator
VPQEPRKQIALRLNEAGLARVEELAKSETEGNRSLMVRKLLAEALQARAVKEAKR